MYIVKIKFRGDKNIYKIQCKYCYRFSEILELKVFNKTIQINFNNVDFYIREEVGE